MAKTKHTPGPWKIRPRGNGEYQDNGAYVSVMPDQPGNELWHNCNICSIYSPQDRTNERRHTGEQMANAKLVAAAPELLEALQKGLGDMIQWRDYLNLQIESFDNNEKQMMIAFYNDVVDRVLKAEAAIKKATE